MAIQDTMTIDEKIKHVEYGMKCVVAAQTVANMKVEAVGKAWPLDGDKVTPADLVDSLLAEALASFCNCAFVERAEFAPDWPSDPRNRFGVR